MSFTVYGYRAWVRWLGPGRIVASTPATRLAVQEVLTSLEPFDRPAGITPTLGNPESALLVLRKALHPVRLETGDVRDPGPPDGCIRPPPVPRIDGPGPMGVEPR